MDHRSTRLGARTTAAAAATLLALAATTTPAHAHVRVKPDSTVTGTYAALTFRVPTESDTASTTKVVLSLPQDQPFRHVSVRPLPGWTASVVEAPLPTPVTADGTTLTKAARTVTWSAQKGAGIGPGEYQEFAISAGPLPAPGMLVLPVRQTYSDGEVVDWATPQADGASEPEHPAPQFEVTAAVADQASAVAGQGDDVVAASESGGSDTTARSLAGGALVVALAVLGLQLVARRRRQVVA